jgi:hypothetical protein
MSHVLEGELYDGPDEAVEEDDYLIAYTAEIYASPQPPIDFSNPTHDFSEDIIVSPRAASENGTNYSRASSELTFSE